MRRLDEGESFVVPRNRVPVDEPTPAATVALRDIGIHRADLPGPTAHRREALHRHLTRLASEHDAETWLNQPLSDDESAIGLIAEWGPAEDCADWADATR